MSPLIAYHATRRACRDSIQRDGLLCRSPAGGRPYGVYIFSDDLDHPTFSRGRCLRWGSHPVQDLWQVAYIGRLTEDRYVENALICLDSIPPSAITLITRNR